MEGVTEDFTVDGTLIQRATYLRGQLDGVIVRFWLNGNVMEETDYSEGELLEKPDCMMSEEKESQIQKKKYGW